MALTIFITIILFLTVIQTAIPYLVKRNIVFGVTIPEQYIKNSKLTSFKKSYSFLVFLISLIILVVYAIWVFRNNPADEQMVIAGTMIVFAIIFISFSFYFYFHGKTMKLKKENKWLENLTQVQITDLNIRSKDEMLPWYVYLIPIIVTIGLIGYTTVQYDMLPDQIPTHWGPSGEADAFTEKTPFSAITLLLILFVMQIMFLGIHVGTKKSGIKLSASSTNASRIRQLRLRKYSSWFMFLISVLLTMMFSFFQLTTIHLDLFINTTMIWIPFLFPGVILVATLFFAIKVGRADKLINGEVEEKITSHDEDKYWKTGLIYFNKNDPSIFVEKRFGVGWTLNFANPFGYLIIILPIVVIFLLTFLL